MKRRTATLASNLMRAINEVFVRGFKDPRIRGLVTVTEVVLSEDFKQARVKVTIFPEEHEALTMHGLQAATPMIRREAMRRVRIKDMPQLTIMLDEGMKAQANVMALLAKARTEAEKRGISFDAEPTTAEPPTPETPTAEPVTTELGTAEPEESLAQHPTAPTGPAAPAAPEAQPDREAP
ncbi:MAG: ribosome-binding factor A [Phycisphaerales bacterium]|jgi:ribosome-binding factor A